MSEKDYLESISSDLREIRTIVLKNSAQLAAQGADLCNHIRRTDLLEGLVKEFKTELAPVKRHVELSRGMGRLALTVSAFALTLASIFKFLAWGR